MHVFHAQVKVNHAAEQFERLAVALQRMNHHQMFLGSVKIDPVCSSPFVYTGPTVFQHLRDLVDRFQTIEQLENVQVVGKFLSLTSPRAAGSDTSAKKMFQRGL